MNRRIGIYRGYEVYDGDNNGIDCVPMKKGVRMVSVALEGKYRTPLSIARQVIDAEIAGTSVGKGTKIEFEVTELDQEEMKRRV